MKLNTKTYRIGFCPGSFLLSLVVLSIMSSSCNNPRQPPPGKEIVNTPEEMEKKIPGLVEQFVGYAASNNGRINDTVTISRPGLLQYLYGKKNYAPFWSKMERWTDRTDSLIEFIDRARLYGLFPQDYHSSHIREIMTNLERDTLARKDAVLWSKADVLLTDALVKMIWDVKLGRLQKDSITLRTDSTLSNEFYEMQLEKMMQSGSLATVIDSLEPKIIAYHELKAGIKNFLDSAVFRDYTYVPYPYYDTVQFKKALRQRLQEEKIPGMDSLSDTTGLGAAIKRYQQTKKLKADGKAGGETIRSLNNTDKEKFFRIALSLDKYKMLRDTMPQKYIWVNLPGYYLSLWDNDTLKLQSKVVVGKPLTRTPELNSSISDMITYPQWTIPTSIIVKEILPALKKDPGYLEKKGYSLLDRNNEEVDPWFVDWSKYKTGIPYKVVQGSGDDNALGVLKFNFPNKYAVYLHDTNQRYLFAQASRSLSHGCVRVQEWQKLANYILNNDSMYLVSKGKGTFTKTDSVNHWLSIKEKHVIPVRERIPLFVRYFTAEGKDGRIIFHDDIYNEDHFLAEKYFKGKHLMP
jgi:L,D-transpeptidase YcbB